MSGPATTTGDKGHLASPIRIRIEPRATVLVLMPLDPACAGQGSRSERLIESLYDSNFTLIDDLFLAPFWRLPTANAEGLIELEGGVGKI